MSVIALLGSDRMINEGCVWDQVDAAARGVEGKTDRGVDVPPPACLGLGLPHSS